MDATLEALAAFARGTKPNRAMTRILRERGYINISVVNLHKSPGREYIAESFTAKGKELLRHAGLEPSRAA